MNIARNGFGKAPTVKSCSEGVWRSSIDESGIEHEAYVILDDREHKKGNLFEFVTQDVGGGGGPPSFPIIFVLDHNGKVLIDFIDPGLQAVEDAVKKQSDIFDKELKEALKSKGKGSGDSSSNEDEKEESK